MPRGVCADCGGETYLLRPDGTRWMMLSAKRCGPCSDGHIEPQAPKQAQPRKHVRWVPKEERLARDETVVELLRDRPATALELAEHFEVEPATVGQWLKRLARDGRVGTDGVRRTGNPGLPPLVWIATQ